MKARESDSSRFYVVKNSFRKQILNRSDAVYKSNNYDCKTHEIHSEIKISSN